MVYKLNISLSVQLQTEHDSTEMSVIVNNIKRTITEAIQAEDLVVDYDEVMDAIEVDKEPIVEE